MKRKARNNFDFSGVITALVTPFKKGRIDFKSMKRLLRQQLDGGTQGFVINGTTGESPTLSLDEVHQLFKFVKGETDHSVPLILGTGTNSTRHTVLQTKMAKKLGADAALVVVPYYNKPPQRGLFAHFSEVARNVSLPILLYNVPGRTVVSMSVETILQLSKVKNIVGVKEASGQKGVIVELVKSAPQKFKLLSGDDATCVDFMLAGGHGVISVLSHVVPRELRKLSDQARAGNSVAVQEYKKFEKLNQLLGVEANPIPVKMMLYLMGWIDSPELRLPLMALEAENKKNVAAELANLGLMK